MTAEVAARVDGPGCPPVPGTSRPHYRGWMEASAVRSPRIGRAPICIAVLVLAADQISKALVVAAAPRGSRGGLVSVRLVRNTGASFGIGAGHPVLITVIAAAVLAAAVIWLVRTCRPGVALCLAVVAGGAAGNLADRLLRSPGARSGRGGGLDSCRWLPCHVQSRGRGHPRRSGRRPGGDAGRGPQDSTRRGNAGAALASPANARTLLIVPSALTIRSRWPHPARH